ncbi:alpha/beta fold hydrolase [Atopomonas sediminilitoris]|uniref:alpha/beta fold hydrolase n=1 Tax=Atopomonas sediminilitoris TaxID=2919919 RepID=UPI001F4D9B0E|nr:alpha/beta hydrolase [Atopomonas sediminilitoris]MCJ8169465.1 alpha/beta hydrolase [Atopomonas sediminilitoris]
MQLISWSHACSAGFTVRGQRSVPSGKPVLHFLHGNGFCGRVYSPLLALLAEHFDLFLSDVQGHGDSDHGGRFHGWNRTAELCVEAWQAFAEEYAGVPVYAVGHSFGGVLTSLIMAQHPSLFQRAVLMDPVLFTPKLIRVMALSDVVGLYSRNKMATAARKRRRHWPNRAAVVEGLRGRGMFKGWTDEALWAFAEHALRDLDNGEVELKCRPSREAEVFGSFPRRLWSSLKKVQTPVQVIYGDRTYPFVGEAVQRWRAINPLVRGLQVPGGHCFMQEQPSDSAQRVLAFLCGGEG